MIDILMKCGCKASGTHNDKPVCVPHFGLTPNAEVFADPQPFLEGRLAYCEDCEKEAPSSLKLPFFEYKEEAKTDSYYCGCRGWN